MLREQSAGYRRLPEPMLARRLRRAITEVEAGLLDFVVSEDGPEVVGGEHWFGIQRALEHVGRIVLIRVSVYLEEYRSIDQGRLRTLLEMLRAAPGRVLSQRRLARRS